MRTFEIWVEGYLITGNQADASKLGEEEAETFDEAVQKYSDKHPGKLDRRIEQDGSITWTDWGCRIYDNESQARQSFG